MSELSENIRHLRKEKGLTQSELAEKIGVSRPIIGAYEEGRTEPKIQTLQNLAQYFSVTVDALLNANLTGSSPDYNKSYIEGSSLRILPIVVNEQNSEMISLVPIKAYAGYLNGLSDTVQIKHLDNFSLPLEEISKNRTYRIFQIKGDSMLPITPGSYIITDYVENWKYIKNDACYVFITKDDGIIYKRAINNIEENNDIIFKSDNPKYEPYPVNVLDILEVWRAVGYISFSIPDKKDLYIDKLSTMVMELKKEINEIKSAKEQT